MWQKLLRMSCLAGLICAGCSPLTTYYKPGETVSRLNRDTTSCEVKALKDAPVATEIRQRAPVYYPGYNRCRSDGRCYRTSGYWADGGVYSVDVNKGLRQRVTDQCMADLGYGRVEIASCSPDVKSRVTAARTTVLPTLGPSSCFIRNDDGSYQILNAG